MVDWAERTCLFNQDYNRLLEQLKHLRGVTGLVFERLLGQPGGRVRVESGKQRIIRDWRTPTAGATVFILSDLGLLEDSGIAQRAWLRVGQQLRLAGCRPVVLLPLPERYLTPELVTLFDCISWDRSSKLQNVMYVPPSEAGSHSPQELDSSSAGDLLAWLSPAMRIEPALLRAVRHQLPIQEVDVGQEVAAWHHDDVIRSNIGFHFQPQKKLIEKYRKRFGELSAANPELAVRIAGLIHTYHQHVFPSQRYEEVLLLAALLGEKAPFSQQEITQAQQHMRELVKAGWEQRTTLPGIQPYLMHLIERQHQAMIKQNDFYQVVWGFKQHERGQLEGMELPEGFDPRNVLAYADVRFGDNRDYVLFQQDHQALQLSSKEHFQEEDDQGFKTGSALATFTTASTLMFRQLRGENGKVSNKLLPLNDNETVMLPLEATETQQVDIASQSLTIERFQKPKWADRIRYGHKNTTTVSSGGVTYYWHEPLVERDGAVLRGIWYPSKEVKNANFPYAHRVLRDQYGVYADIELYKLTQRFRWIEPAVFQMGSPEDEAGRDFDETQHEVMLTQGYWLSDVVCAQALWMLVMRHNPSEFKGKNDPVENVSWHDINEFMVRVNRQYPELQLRLPKEAEWENACRAGTTSAFSFGGEWLLDNVISKSGVVNSPPLNQWGLYDMHSGVWEWCQDWFDNYPKDPVVNPQGAKTGLSRVLRGGSWTRGEKLCRSAYRDSTEPDNRFSSVGFRFARNHEFARNKLVDNPNGSWLGRIKGVFK